VIDASKRRAERRKESRVRIAGHQIDMSAARSGAIDRRGSTPRVRSKGRASTAAALRQPAITKKAIRRCDRDRADLEGLGQVANRRQAMPACEFAGLKRGFDCARNSRRAVAADDMS
jgi:hypothetical protein